MEYRSTFIANRRGERLFVAERIPGGATECVWLVCPPLLEEHTVSHDVFVTLASALARRGHHVVRFDYAGHGDSDGDVSSLGLDDWTDDAEDVAHAVFGRRRSVVLFGCRGGALVAAAVATRISPARVVLWCPVDGPEQLDEWMRIRTATELTTATDPSHRSSPRSAQDTNEVFTVLGWPIGNRLRTSLLAARIAPALGDVAAPVAILQLKTHGARSADLSRFGAAPASVNCVAGRQFWLDGNYIDHQQRELVAATVGQPDEAA